jgi:hypothetical protein
MDQLIKRCYDVLTTAIAPIPGKPWLNLKNDAQSMIADRTSFCIIFTGSSNENAHYLCYFTQTFISTTTHSFHSKISPRVD